MAAEHVRGKITKGEKTVYSGELWVETTVGHGGLKSWHGGFTTEALIAAEGGCQIELVDGRKGVLHINNVKSGSHRATVASFQGSGPLA